MSLIKKKNTNLSVNNFLTTDQRQNILTLLSSATPTKKTFIKIVFPVKHLRAPVHFHGRSLLHYTKPLHFFRVIEVGIQDS